MKKISFVLVSTLLSLNCWSADGDAAVARVYRTECVPDAQHKHVDEVVRERDGSTAVQIEIKGAVILESRLSFADNHCQILLGKSVRNGTLSVDANDANVSYVTRNGYYMIRSNGHSERTIELPYHRLISDLSQLPAEIQQATQGLANPRVYMVTGFMAMAFRSGQNRQSEENKLTISQDGQQLKILGAVLTLQK